MSVQHAAIQWTPQKKRYDLALVAVIVACLAAWVAMSLALRPQVTVETLIIRGTAVAALLLLHVILAMGPLARLDRRFLPLLYNRRHLGVAMFLLAATHGAFTLVQFHALGDANPLVSVLTASRPAAGSGVVHQPFEVFGLAALVILLVMAATSHDFWLKNLGAPAWKAIHLSVFVAYGAIVAHVAFGALQSERNPLPALVLAAGAATLLALHLVAARREAFVDRARENPAAEGFVDALAAADLVEGRGRVAKVGGRRVAVFLTNGRVHVTSNACRHQGGPLGEARILDGCITCPWHGWQYRAEDGRSPPPFSEVVETYRARVTQGRVLVHPEPLPPGTRSEGEPIAPAGDRTGAGDESDEFHVGWMAAAPPRLARFTRRVALALGGGALLLAGLLAASQRPMADGLFEYGHLRTFEGILRAQPFPHLAMTVSPPDVPERALVLVGAGKRGIPGNVTALDGHAVRFRGTLIRRDIAMAEITDVASLEDLGAAPATPAETIAIGDVTLTGELVDTKCWLGVMRPATGKVHRSCAVRCLSGGVPPGLLLRRDDDTLLTVMLAGADGGPLAIDPLLAARVLRVSGALGVRDGIATLAVRDWRLLDAS